MSETSQTPACSRCGAPLSADALKGLCPRCLMALNLAAPTEIPGETGPHGTKVVKPPPSPEEIANHFPQFEILECLGRGGMGVVYKARQPKLNRMVALKILAPEKVAETKFAERFEREAQALARLNHQNIVTVYDFGETDGLYYLLMEFVDGVSLRRLLQTRKIAPEEALTIVPKICEALQFAHDQGVVHRDIKPENVLLDKQGRVKIADFGIAKIVGEPSRAGGPLSAAAAQPTGGARGATRPAGALTQDQVLGTPHYMAPEQVEKPQMVDHRADIYSLGVVFYEMLTGELPLGKFQPPSKKVEVDVRLDEVVLHALEKEPERRYQHASEVKSDVETIATAREPSSSLREESYAEGSEIRTSTPAFESHFSRTAIMGASLITLAAPAVLFLSVARHEGGPGQTPTALGLVLSFVLVPLAWASAFGTTILGWVAVSQIRHSAGKLYGLGLAVFDGLLFPLLALDGFILLVGIGLTSFVQRWINQQGLHESVWNRLAPLLLVLLIYGGMAIADYWIVRRVWHAVTKPLPDFVPGGRRRLAQTETESPQSNQGQNRFWRRFAVTVVAVVLGLILIPVGWILLTNLVPSFSQARLKAQRLQSFVAAHANGLPSPTAQTPSFGPVIERVVTGALDLDDGTLMELPLPQPLGERDPARYAWFNNDKSAFPWMRQHGVDVIDLGNHGLEVVDAFLVPLKDKDWRTLTPEGLRKKIEALGLPLAPSSLGFSSTEGAYGIQTREGGLAILQITDARLPRGVKIRYKLLQAGPAGSEFAKTSGVAEHIAMQAAPGRYQLTLTNRVSFEVMAVTRNPRHPSVWWKPNGEPFSEPPVKMAGVLETAPDYKPENEFLIDVRTHVPADTGAWQYRLDFQPHPIEQQSAIVTDGSGGQRAASIVEFQQPPASVDLSIKAATGPWEAVAVFDGQRTRELVPDLEVTCGPPRFDEQSKSYQFELMHNVDRAVFALRMVARLRDGQQREVELNSGLTTGAPAKGFTVIWPGEFKPEDVKEYVLERTPWVRGEIRHIALRPKLGKAQAATTFGPVIEREICFSMVTDRPDRFLDLDRDQFVTPPLEVGQDFAKGAWIGLYSGVDSEEAGAQMQNWVRASGADLLADGWQKRLTLLGGWAFDQDTDQAGLIKFEHADPEKTFRQLQEIDEEMRKSRNLDTRLSFLQPPGSYPTGISDAREVAQTRQQHDTFLFRTAAGSFGILQFGEFRDNPPRVSFRYKLLKDLSATSGN